MQLTLKYFTKLGQNICQDTEDDKSRKKILYISNGFAMACQYIYGDKKETGLVTYVLHQLSYLHREADHMHVIDYCVSLTTGNNINKSPLISVSIQSISEMHDGTCAFRD